MRTGATFAASESAVPERPQDVLLLRQTLVVTAFTSSLLYIATTMVGAYQWPGYDRVSQTIRELSAIDAPSRLVVALLMTVYAVLALAGLFERISVFSFMGIVVFAIVTVGQKQRVRVALHDEVSDDEC